MLLHGNSFQRNLWSETLLFGLRITATTEKWADCRNTNGLMNHFTRQEAELFVFHIFNIFPEQPTQNVDVVCSVLFSKPFCIGDDRPLEEMFICGRMCYSFHTTCLQLIG